LPSFARAAIEGIEPITTSAVSPPRMRWVIAPIVAYVMVNLCPDARSKSPAISLSTDCNAAADKSRISSAAAGGPAPSNAATAVDISASGIRNFIAALCC
jgi:hypothetical protein